MADWFSTVKNAVVNLLCGEVWKDTPKSTSPVSLQGCELEVLSSELPEPIRTMISLDDSSDDSSISDMDEETPLTRSVDTGQGNGVLGNGLNTPCQVQCKGLPDIPVRTKAAQGVILEGGLYLGGGYVTNSKQGAIIYKFDPIFEMWDPLPPCPLKLFGTTSYNGQLVIAGGKEVGNLSSSLSNKVFSWDKEGGCWKSTISPMTFARVSPVVVSYEQFLIVAGGNKGSLDYNMEIYSRTSNRWTTAHPLPTKCFPYTSTVCDNTWYLLDLSDSVIKSADIRCVTQLATCDTCEELSSDDSTESPAQKTSVWISLPKPPFTPKKISTIDGKLLAICSEACKVSCYVYNKDTQSWSSSNKLPTMCEHSSAIADDKGGLFLFGGEGGLDQYSNKLYRLTLKTSDDLLLNKAKKTKPPITFNFH